MIADLTGQTRWARLIESAVPTCLQDFETIVNPLHKLFRTGYSRSIGFIAYVVLRPRSLAYAPRKIVDRKDLLCTNDGPFSLPLSSHTSVHCWLECCLSSSLLARVNKRTTHRGEDGMSRQGDQQSSFSKGPHILLNIGIKGLWRRKLSSRLA